MNNKEDLYKEKSKERLNKNCKKKLQTTMIGALSSIEEHFGFLWGHESDEPLSEDQEKMRLVYEELRSDVLDKGNTQIRNIDAEFTQYDITWNRYQYQIPVKPL
mgnify:FL=1|jgi:hypothetical protein